MTEWQRSETLTHEHDNVRFSLSNPRAGLWVFNAERISDEHRLPGQMMLAQDPSTLFSDIQAMWWNEHPGLNVEPLPGHCYACGKALVSDADTEYQFDNALWIGFHGGYGMFVDACDFPLNTEDRWLRDEDGEYQQDGDGKLLEDLDWVPEYREERILPGRPDYEAVICHDCAHFACDLLPWMDKLLNPMGSHAHRSRDYPRLLTEGHHGWDLDSERIAPREN
jgi:hypothetical protein